MWDVNRTDRIRENRLLARWGQLLPRHPHQIGGLGESDAELLPLDDRRVLALTVDTVAEEVAMGLYRDPRTAGRIAVLASLSDLAAVGAEPLGLLLATTLPRQDFAATQERLCEGIDEASQQARVFVLGGDTNEGENLEVSCVAAGILPRHRIISRVGARPGDRIFVSGPIGLGGALAAAVLNGADGSTAAFTEADYTPVPRLREGQVVRRFAGCCMDTSDGLIATLDQLARLNATRLCLDTDFADLLHPAAATVRAALDLPAFALAASHHGEFELVFTIPPEREAEFLAAAADIRWHPLRMGRVTAGSGIATPAGEIDGAWVRNLLHETAGDARAYALRLIEAGRLLEPG